MRTSDSLDQLIPALILARGKFDAFTKDNTAKVESAKGGYSYKYGDLGALFDASFPALLENGLMLSQTPDVDEQGFCLVTRLSHSSGQWMEGRFPLRVYDRAQEMGSLITYARRYAAQSMLGIAAEADDDGATAHAADPKAKEIGARWMVPAGITHVASAPTQKPGVTKYTVTLTTGEKAATISEKLGKACEAVKDDGAEYMVDLAQTQWGVDIKGLKPLPAPSSQAAHMAAPASTQSM